MSKIKVGDVFKSNNCGEFEVVELVSNKKSRVRFLSTDGTIETHNSSISCGKISDPLQIKQRSKIPRTKRDPLTKTVCGVGYLGVGKYKAGAGGSGKLTREYRVWTQMIVRCYDDSKDNASRYVKRGVIVCDEWHCFQTFAEWFNRYSREGYQLDKDIIVQGSKIYSPETCCMVPQKINALFITGSYSVKSKRLPVGLTEYPTKKYGLRYSVNVRVDGKQICKGIYPDIEEALDSYTKAKEGIVKEMAREYLEKGLITTWVYRALMRWKVVPFPD